MGKLTDVQLKHWVKAGKPVARAHGEVPGLTFTVSARGTAAWILRYRFGGKARELTLGRHPPLSIKGAKAAALEALRRIQQGTDVAREKRKEKTASAAAMTFRQLSDDYARKVFPKLAANTVAQQRRCIDKVILPKLGHLMAREVEAGDIVMLIEHRTPSVAAAIFKTATAIFRHGTPYVIQRNPCAGLSLSAIVNQAADQRTRIMLTEPELRAFMPALSFIAEHHALAIKILLGTCVRISELVNAEWSHVDFERATWTIPPENSKTKSGFTIPLAPAVADWFKALQVFACGSRYVLPQRNGKAPIGRQQLNAVLTALCGHLGDQCRFVTPHDLRSTARSHLAALGVPVVVAERCLNHSLGGLVAVYDQHDYMTERRGALDLWARFILTCEAGKEWGVVPLRQVAA